MDEKWKDIKNYEGFYQISNLGRVKSLIFRNNVCNIKKEKILKPTDNGNGYLIVSLHKNKNRKVFYIHRLVGQTFIENKEHLKEINHKDGNRKNNNIDNLEWCNRKYNVEHSYRNNGRKSAFSEIKGNKHRLSIPIKQYSLDRQFIKKFDSMKQASEEMNICYTSIQRCRTKKQKTAGNYIWVD